MTDIMPSAHPVPTGGYVHKAPLLIGKPSQLHHPARSHVSPSRQIPPPAVQVAYVALSAKYHVQSTSIPSVIFKRFFIIFKKITK